MRDGGVRATGLLLVAGAASLWGTVGVASKTLYQLTEITPLAVGFFRLALSAPILLTLALLVFGVRALAFRGRGLLLVVLLGLAMALYQAFYFTAVAQAGVAIATLITICSAPLLVALLSRLFLGEAMTRRTALALLAGLCGTALLVGFPGEVSARQTELLSGAAWASGSALCYALFTLCSRALAPNHHPFALIAVGFGAGALILLPFAPGTGAIGYPAPALMTLLYIGLVPTALAYVLYFRGMRSTRATHASIVTLMEPLTATLLAWLLLQERLGPAAVGGGLLLLASLIILARGNATGR